MALTSIPRPYVVVVATTVLASVVFFLWTPLYPAAASHYFKFAPSMKSTNIVEIHNETLGFERIMIVNLPGRPDKLDSNTLAASLVDFSFSVIPAISGTEVPWKSLPHTYNTNVANGTIGAYRSILNAVRTVITDRLSTALIMEDDVDWDVSLKQQLQDFALGSRFLTSNQSIPYDAAKDAPHSPYGDGWDVLNIGHCGSGQHLHSPWAPADGLRTFKIYNDPTVPPANRIHTPGGAPDAQEWEAPGTRYMYRGWSSCSWAAAVSYRGARKILDRMSVEPFNNSYDNGLQALCQAAILDCVQIHPPLLGAHTPIGDAKKESDIDDSSRQGVTEKPRTHNVAYSVKGNVLRLLEGMEAEAQWEDMPELEGEVEVEYISAAERRRRRRRRRRG